MQKQGDVDKSSLELLSNALSRLQNGYQLDSQELWLGNTPDQLCRVSSDSGVEETATSLLDTIQQLKRVTQLLDDLSNSSKAFISTLQERSKPMLYHHGIMSLPDEILVQIYEYIKDDYAPVTDENGASRKSNRSSKYNVCRRIRNLALSTPTLWTSLHSRMPREEFQMFFKRSQNADLSITFRTPLPDTRFHRFFKDLLPHTNRWRELTIECMHDVPFGWLFFNTDMMKVNEKHGTRELDLPTLTSLTVHSQGRHNTEPYTPGGEEDFFTYWKMPKLCGLSLCSVIPSRSVPEERTNLFKDHITSLTFTFGDVDIKPEFFLAYIATLPNLRELTLEGVLPGNPPQEESQPRASLQYLTSLTLLSCDDTTLQFVLESFDMPNASKLILNMDISGYTTSRLTFLPILYDHTDFICQIKTFELSLDRSKTKVHPHGILDHLLGNFRALEHFSFSTNPARPFPPTGEMLERLWMFTVRHWKLKTIRVSDCSDLSAPLPRIMYYLARKRDGENELGTAPGSSTTQNGQEMSENRFERLEIVGRTNFVDEDFSCVPREKIVWVPGDSGHVDPPDSHP